MTHLELKLESESIEFQFFPVFLNMSSCHKNIYTIDY
jgi:hypothetical protein